MVTVALLCCSLAFQVIYIYGQQFAASGLIFPFSAMLSTVVIAGYEYKLARQAVWMTWFCQTIFVTVVNISVLFNTHSDILGAAYYELYSDLYRFILASSSVMFVGYFMHEIAISKFRVYFHKHVFSFVYIALSVVLQGIFACAYCFFSFFGKYSLSFIKEMALNTWCYQIMASILLFPIVVQLTYFIKKAEQKVE
jgi:uncharacterized PurR-regulated membrane protein YhhQ (DUF165 family)